MLSSASRAKPAAIFPDTIRRANATRPAAPAKVWQGAGTSVRAFIAKGCIGHLSSMRAFIPLRFGKELRPAVRERPFRFVWTIRDHRSPNSMTANLHCPPPKATLSSLGGKPGETYPGPTQILHRRPERNISTGTLPAQKSPMIDVNSSAGREFLRRLSGRARRRVAAMPIERRRPPALKSKPSTSYQNVAPSF